MDTLSSAAPHQTVRGSGAHGMLRALKTQSVVVLALMLRETRTRYGRQKAGYLWALVEPVLHIIVFDIIFQLTFRMVPFGQSLPMFLATGFATYLGFNNVLHRTQGGFASNEALLAYPPVTVMDVFFGRAFLELATWSLVTFAILGFLITFGPDLLPHSVLMMIAAMILLFGIAFGAGLFIGVLTQFFPSVENLLMIPFRVLYFTSAVFYLPDSMPPTMRSFFAWNPVLQGITMFRMGYYGNYHSHMLNVPYLVACSVLFVLLAFVTERLTRKALVSRR